MGFRWSGVQIAPARPVKKPSSRHGGGLSLCAESDHRSELVVTAEPPEVEAVEFIRIRGECISEEVAQSRGTPLKKVGLGWGATSRSKSTAIGAKMKGDPSAGCSDAFLIVWRIVIANPVAWRTLISLVTPHTLVS
jgi:hypothetical protein